MSSTDLNRLRVSKAARRLLRRQNKESKSRIEASLVRMRRPEPDPEPAEEHEVDMPPESWSFEELCLPLYHEMVAFARRLTNGNVARAEDLVQDSMTKA